MNIEQAERVAEVKIAEGLHMRPAMQFVDCASEFAAEITVVTDKQTADAKSIMQLTMLAATKGTKLTIKAAGVGAKAAVESLAAIVENENANEPA